MFHENDPTGDVPEQFQMIDDRVNGIRGIIVVHSTALGPAAGGCRLWTYPGEPELNADAMRLARGMSYKNALAGLPFGGGKAVLQRPPGEFDRAALFLALAEAVERLAGQYVTAEDVGTTLDDMKVVRTRTRYVAGLEHVPGRAGGDPSPWTALGVFLAMQEAARTALGAELRDLTVAVQGTGNVGAGLCRLLHGAGARLIVADVDSSRAQGLSRELGASIADVDSILDAEADVLAPCALGGVLNTDTIPRLKVRLVCGGANNQLATGEDGRHLQRIGITYAPDYLVNAGGIINVAAEYLGETTEQVRERIGLIPQRLRAVLETSARSGESTQQLADAMAQHVIAHAKAEAA